MATVRRDFAMTNQVAALKNLRPMNLYGWSKHLFDLAVAERAAKGDKPAAAMGRS
jgi:ADP-L-glycero-D-manno-heptose 6-epimerase